MSFLKSTLQTNVDDYELNRDDFMKRFDEGVDYLQNFENDLGLADVVEDDCLSLDFLSKLENLDSVAFIQVDVAEKNNSNQLFGEISKAVADAIDAEVEDMFNTNEANAAAQATPNILRNNYSLKKKRVIDETLFNVDGDTFEQNMMTIRCMEIYSEMAQTTDAISERTRKRMKEHERVLLFIGVNPVPNPDLSEAHLTEVISYTIAVVSNIRDGTIPDVNKYKDKVVELINNSTNKVVESLDVTATIKSFSEVAETLSNCKAQIADNPKAKSFVNTISAIESICQKQQEKINDLYTEFG